jgi:lysophospholipase L1-like esterase
MVKKIFLSVSIVILAGLVLFLYLYFADDYKTVDDPFVFVPNAELTKSNLFPVDKLEVSNESSSSVKLTWEFADRKMLMAEDEPIEYSALSGFRIYRDGYWMTDVGKNARKLIDADLLPDTKYSYAVSPLTFDNKIEGESSDIVEITTVESNLSVSKYTVLPIGKLLVEGDSVAAGQRAMNGMGWADQVAKSVLTNSGSFTNDAVSGSLSADVLSRIKAKNNLETYDAVAIAVGLNDLYGSSQEIGNVSLYEYKKNISNIVDTIGTGDHKTVVLIGIPYYRDCCGSEKSFIKVDSWNKGLAEIALHRSLLYVDIYNLMLREGADNLMDDVLHPNQEGHNVIAKEVISKISQQSQ